MRSVHSAEIDASGSLLMSLMNNLFYIYTGEFWLDSFGEQGPPHPEVILDTILRPGERGPMAVEVDMPRLCATNEVDDFHIGTIMFVCWQVSIGRSGTHVVQEGKMFFDIFTRPAGEIMIQKSLIASIKGSVDAGKFDDFPEGVEVGAEDEDTTVEAVRPPGIWGSGKLLALEQVVAVLDNEGVSIQEDTLGVLGEGPAVQLREGDAQLGTVHQHEVGEVTTVQGVYHHYLIKGFIEPVNHGGRDAFGG